MKKLSLTVKMGIFIVAIGIIVVMIFTQDIVKTWPRYPVPIEHKTR